jgi:tetratricopeptide (TPR) repeat protein
VQERVLGVDSPALGVDLRLLATLDHQQGDFAAGLVVGTRALALAVASEHPPGQETFASHMTLAQLARGAKDRVAMRAHYEAALAIGEATLHPDDENLAGLRYSFGSALAEDHDDDRALALLGQAEASWRRKNNPRAALVDAARAEILQDRGRCAEAVPLFELAVAGMRASGGDPANLQIARFNLADCRWQANLDRPVARAAMLGLRDELEADDKQLRPEVEAWLRSHK